MRLLHFVWARPYFLKVAPVYSSAWREQLDRSIVHTGQHQDDGLSDSFSRQLCGPPPDVNLGIASQTHAVQTARIMERLEPVFLASNTDWVVVYGDVNSTVAAALVA